MKFGKKNIKFGPQGGKYTNAVQYSLHISDTVHYTVLHWEVHWEHVLDRGEWRVVEETGERGRGDWGEA